MVKSVLASSLELEITICGLKSLRIYRRVIVPGDILLSDFAELIDIAFGWMTHKEARRTPDKEVPRPHHKEGRRNRGEYKFVMPATRYPDSQVPRDPTCDVVFGPGLLTSAKHRQGLFC